MNLGKLAGPGDAAAVTYDWKFYHSLPALTLWAIVALAVVLVKSNRHPRTLAILAPLVILAIAWPAVTEAMGMGAMDRRMYGIIFNSILAGIAMLWLLSDRLSRLGGIVRIVAFITIMLVTCAAATASQGLDAELMLQLTIFDLAIALAVLTSLAFARLLSGKRYRPMRFSLWLAVTTLSTSLLAMAAFGVFVTVIISRGGGFSIARMMQMLAQTLLAGSVISLFLYVIHLIFLLFTLNTQFYRERFCKCLAITTAPTDSTTSPTTPETPIAALND